MLESEFARVFLFALSDRLSLRIQYRQLLCVDSPFYVLYLYNYKYFYYALCTGLRLQYTAEGTLGSRSGDWAIWAWNWPNEFSRVRRGFTEPTNVPERDVRVRRTRETPLGAYRWRRLER